MKHTLWIKKFKKSSKPTKALLVLFVFLFLVTFYLLLATSVSAQIPPKPYVKCYQTRNPEFQSTRPYQKSPCNRNITETALFCGNRLILSDEVVKPYDVGPGCKRVGEYKYNCSYKERKVKELAIDLSNAEFPIMGNSELVMNSQQPSGYTDELDDSTKVNEYVSWYLSGVPNKPEYDGLDVSNVEDVDQLINYSGPIKKLLPLSRIHKAQIATIKASKDTRHNQIAVCTKGGKAVECYKGDNKEAKNETRISAWGKKLSLLRTIPNSVKNLIAKTGLIEEESIPWNKRYPPLEESFEDPIYYQKAYSEWRGKSCLLAKIPFTDIAKLFCVDNPLIKNAWADFFPYVPLSSTEDRKGEVFVNSGSASSNDTDVIITDVVVDAESAKLWFAHTEESAELASLLQSTYVPLGNPSTGVGSYISEYDRDCYLLNVRSNPGDDLFPGEILGTVEYTVQYQCTFDRRTKRSCKKDIGISLGVKTKTPKADELWERLVAGPSGVFKRIFPKVGEGGAILGILDIPAVTNVIYTGAKAVNPTERRGEDAELYFPHIGGIHEYFLKGIQTALRPKGYGEPILSGAPTTGAGCSVNGEGSIPDLPKAISGACKLRNAGSGYRSITPLPPKMVEIFEAAGQTFQIPPSMLLAIMFGEGAFERGWKWTNENVIKWSKECATMPDCDPKNPAGQGAFAIFEREWDNGEGIQTIAPDREATRCNFLDEVFNVARKVSRESWGWDGYPPPQSCFGISYNTGSDGPTSCSDWDNNDIVTGFRQWAGACVSTENSCLLGISAGTCPEDNCEKYDECFGGGASCSSHIHCSWDVFKHYR